MFKKKHKTLVGLKRERERKQTNAHDAYLKDGPTCVKVFGAMTLDQKVSLILNPYDSANSILWSFFFF